MKKHMLLILLVALFTASMLFAAGAQEAQTTQAKAKTTLEFWTWRPEDIDFYAKQIALFEAANPDIKVVQTALKNTEYNTILASSLSGGAGPDVFQGRAYGGLVTFADSGFLEPLEGWMPELKNYSANALLGATSPTDGKIYGSPAVSQTVFMYYNMDVYKKLGLSIPKTWNEMISNFEAVKKAGYIPLGNGAKDGWCLETLLGGMGAGFYGGSDFYNAVVAGTKTFEDPAFIRMIEQMKSLTKYMPDMFMGISYEDMRANFINEMSPHLIAGSYEAAFFKSQNPKLNFGIFAVPSEKATDPAYVSVYADMNFAMNAHSAKKDAAIKFLKFLSSKDFGKSMVTEMQMVSAVPGVDASADPFISRVLELQKNATPYLFLVGFRYEQPTGSSLWQAAAQGVMAGTLTAKQAAKQVQDGIASYYKPFKK
ncbi:extracellular solute-binding protein [Sphaerochaeta sp. PS]|uniref:ABC transporter substrate-binding protein n=1 Tax=Sphaerochaeta sp. PS TaxID=3076336 RepID=UPI0028A3C7AC|nr:extracellular solute-binding protein [Sphaerochaeta sp. PS]MDT4761631.1 extracellular solute-binding protein [Sphaerochaeta sp. PS]